MTKAASHLLWSDDFSRIRSYLVDHLVWMISDSTGIPPRIARAAGLVEETYGMFDAPARYGRVDARDAADLHALFVQRREQPLPFLFEYPDRDHHGHIVVIRRPQHW